MTPGGWINLLLSVGFVVGLLAWCVRKLLYGGRATRSDKRPK